jgi:hypothetical protein
MEKYFIVVAVLYDSIAKLVLFSQTNEQKARKSYKFSCFSYKRVMDFSRESRKFAAEKQKEHDYEEKNPRFSPVAGGPAYLGADTGGMLEGSGGELSADSPV